MTGLARVIRGHVITAFKQMNLWHERDISHSSAERITISSIKILLNHKLNYLVKTNKK
ncbi:hypothetical protein QMZ09_08970 [Enterococcus faecalis]